MPIPKITATQFEQQIRDGIENRTLTFDTGVGPIPEVVIRPPARVFERQNDRIRKVSLILSLANSTEFAGEFATDLNDLVFNEGLIRQLGSRATTVLVFSRANAPSTDQVVQRGFPVGTVPDESTGRTVTFVTTEEKILPASTASSYYNFNTKRYELSVPAIAVIEGADGRVGPNRVNRELRPLVGFDAITNPTATVGGRSVETDDELIERYLIAILGRQLGTPLGVEKFSRDNFPDVEDTLTVYGSNPLLTRAGTDAGAVDVYTIGDQIVELTESVTFLGLGQLLEVSSPPLRDILSVINTNTGDIFSVADLDYEVVQDASGYENSTRAADGIRFIAGGANPVPSIGDSISITYTYNQLIRNLQSEAELDENLVFGRDLLYKEGLRVGVAIDARLRTAAGFNPTTIKGLVRQAILDFVNSLELGDDVERSDIQGVVRAISGVDNFIFNAVYRNTDAPTLDDVIVGDNEYARTEDADLTVTTY